MFGRRITSHSLLECWCKTRWCLQAFGIFPHAATYQRDRAIIPIIKGGLKIFDPHAHTRALLANMISRALSPGPEF